MDAPHMIADDAERAVLGAVLAGWSDVDALELSEAEFRTPQLGQMWQVLTDLRRSGVAVDPVTARPRMGNIKLTTDPGVFLIDLLQACPVTINAPHYADQVREAARWRRLANACISASQRVQSGEGSTHDIAEQVRELFDLPVERGGTETLSEFLPDVFAAIETGRMVGRHTPWVDLDRLINGLADSRMYVFAARPGVGKTLAGANIARHFALHHKLPAHFASLEMSRVELGMRLIADIAGVDWKRLVGQSTDQQDWNRMANATDLIHGSVLAVDDTTHQTMGHIRKSAKQTKAKHGGLGVVVIDYLQMVTPTTKRSNRQEEVAEISRQAKLLSRDLQVPVVALAQLNRGGVGSEPQMSDIRDSGAIEQDADVIVTLWAEEDDSGLVHGQVVKQRSGPLGNFDLLRQGNYGRLVSVA